MLSGVGNITSGGFYTANQVGSALVQVTDDALATDTATVTVETLPLQITPDFINLQYNAGFDFNASGGQPPYVFSILTAGDSGAIVADTGVYTAPATAGTITIQVADSPPRFWSVAVVAPQSEVEEALSRGSFRLLLLQGVVVLAVILGAGTIIWLENRWSSVLEANVIAKTDALAKSEEKYRSLIESAEDLIFTVDRDIRFQSLNTFTAKFFGGTPERFVGHPIASAFPEAVAAHQAELIAQVHRSGKSIREEFELPIGERSAWISANFMPVKTDAGEVGSILCIARDITETKTCSASW